MDLTIFLALGSGILISLSSTSLKLIQTFAKIGNKIIAKTKRTAGTTYDVYESVGLINNGITFGTITFTPLADTPDTLYYVNPTNVSASGVINIVDSLPLSSEQEFVYVVTHLPPNFKTKLDLMVVCLYSQLRKWLM